jgi:L-aspartate oxidase
MAGLGAQDGSPQPDLVDDPEATVGARRIELADLPVTGSPLKTSSDGAGGRVSVAGLLDRLQRAMTAGAGVRRSAASLEVVDLELSVVGAELSGVVGAEGTDPVAVAELSNLVTLAHALVSAAVARAESRGTHWRDDHPDTDPRYRIRYLPAYDPTTTGRGPITEEAVTHERR